LEGHRKAVRYVAFHPGDGRWLATASEDGAVKLWETATGKELRTLRQPGTMPSGPSAIKGLVFHPDGKSLACLHARKGGTVEILETETGKSIRLIPTHHPGEAQCLAFSPDGRYLATGGRGSRSGIGDEAIKVWDAESRACVLTLSGHTNFVSGLTFSRDGQRLASAGWDRTVQVWDLTKGEKRKSLVLRGHTHWVTGVAFSPDGKRLAS